MSFLTKIKSNQGYLFGVLGALAGGFILYKLIKNTDNKENKQTPEQQRKRQIQTLRKNINPQNPSFEELKKILDLSIQEAKTKLIEHTKLFREKRMKFNRTTRKSNMKQYLDLVYDGLIQMQNISMREKTQWLKDLGIKEANMKKCQEMVDMAMLQITQNQKNDIGPVKPMKIQEVKVFLKREVQFIKKEGVQYAQLIIEATKDWSTSKKASLAALISTVITDGAFQDYPQLDTDALEEAQTQFQRELLGQLQQIQVAITPMMLKIGQALVGQNDQTDYTDLEHEKMEKMHQY